MSYLVLARKYRPAAFSEVVGQDHVTRTIRNAIRSGRLGHAFLFSGLRGVGKTSVARILAKTLNCGDENDIDEPCSRCDSCREIDEGRSLDVVEMDAASHTGVDDIRELRDLTRLRVHWRRKRCPRRSIPQRVARGAFKWSRGERLS